jgi:hypothetical protein
MRKERGVRQQFRPARTREIEMSDGLDHLAGLPEALRFWGRSIAGTTIQGKDTGMQHGQKQMPCGDGPITRELQSYSVRTFTRRGLKEDRPPSISMTAKSETL